MIRGPKRKEIKWSVDDSTNCWNCTSHKPDSYGYPRIVFNYKNKKIFRLMYEKYKGPIPEGLLVRHTCDNRNCINPDHLLTGTIQDNIRDMVQRGRQILNKGTRGPDKVPGGRKLKNQNINLVR